MEIFGLHIFKTFTVKYNQQKQNQNQIKEKTTQFRIYI